MVKIPLGLDCKYFTCVDDIDAAVAMQHLWLRHKGRKTYYASRLTYRDGAPFRIYLHRELLGVGKKTQVDHRDGDGLNNQRYNLRAASNAQNHRAKITRPAYFKSRFRGVYWHKQNQNWCAQIKVNYKKKHLGSFPTENGAARAYDNAARRFFGDFCQLNFSG
jgi:hypothetical protein